MSCVERYNKPVFVILSDNTALQFETCRAPAPPSNGEASAWTSIGGLFKSFMPRVARVIPKKTVLPSGRTVSLASPSTLAP